MSDQILATLLNHWELGAGAGGASLTGYILWAWIKSMAKRQVELEQQVGELQEHITTLASREELNKSITSLRREFEQRTNEVKSEILNTKMEIRQDLHAINSMVTQQLSQAIEIIKIAKQ